MAVGSAQWSPWKLPTYPDGDGGETAEGYQEGEKHGQTVGPNGCQHRQGVDFDRDAGLEKNLMMTERARVLDPLKLAEGN